MNKFNVILTTAIISGFVVLCALSGGNQSANPQAVVIKATEPSPGESLCLFVQIPLPKP